MPQVLPQAFWGGLWGIVLALALPFRGRVNYWVFAMAFGLIAPPLVGWFVVPLIKAADSRRLEVTSAQMKVDGSSLSTSATPKPIGYRPDHLNDPRWTSHQGRTFTRRNRQLFPRVIEEPVASGAKVGAPIPG